MFEFIQGNLLNQNVENFKIQKVHVITNRKLIYLLLFMVLKYLFILTKYLLMFVGKTILVASIFTLKPKPRGQCAVHGAEMSKFRT